MTEYKTIGGEIYMFAGGKKTAGEADDQADSYRRQGRIVCVEEETRITKYRKSVYSVYTRSK